MRRALAAAWRNTAPKNIAEKPVRYKPRGAGGQAG
jgi:hypothetical protein